ncbi:hypothetical protein [Mobilicoccus massiliensis]|uniref:hypothetical protein n=1 Tax=Mobilicoccus massiliensis TaxID=1522310 RepID=UPI00114424C9|nr:hypothetical protein [Mobilicoccus massiliensis]
MLRSRTSRPLEGMAAHAERRAQVWAGVSPNALAPLSFHLESMRAAGWTEADVVWRYLDDVIVFGRR